MIPKLSMRHRGFTIIEILVVVMIIAVLATLVVPRFLDRPDEARQVRAQQDIRAIVTALNMYRLDNFVYPSTDQGLQALVTRPGGAPEAPNWRAGGYLERLPMDPWGNPYQYLYPGRHAELDVYSYGSDGRPGGEGTAADIGNWMN